MDYFSKTTLRESTAKQKQFLRTSRQGFFLSRKKTTLTLLSMNSTFMHTPPNAFLSTSGVMARAAGVPALSKPVNPMALETTWNSTTSSPSRYNKPGTVYAPIAPAGWTAAEPKVHPIHEQKAAGVDSVVDNTMRFKPLPPRWGKTREVGPAETPPPFRILPAATLSANKGMVVADLPPVESAERMSSVLPMYSPSAPLFDNHYPPDRIVAGFIGHPKALTQQAYVDENTATYKASFKYNKPSPGSSPTSSMAKFEYDLSASHAHIPVRSKKMLFPGVDRTFSATDFM